MANQKISELTALLGSNVADDDALAIVDTSTTQTKKINFSEFKLAFSDGIYLGGTGAANLLDSYEEGTWTVEMYDAASGGNASSSQITGRYTKIGQQVIASFYALNNVSTSGLTSGNTVYFTLPFAASSTGRACGSCHLDAVTFPTGTTMITPSVSNSNSRAQLSASGSAAGDTTVKVSSFNGTSSDVVNWTLSYRTDS